jgi:hypothetical protein
VILRNDGPSISVNLVYQNPIMAGILDVLREDVNLVSLSPRLYFHVCQNARDVKIGLVSVWRKVKLLVMPLA